MFVLQKLNVQKIVASEGKKDELLQKGYKLVEAQPEKEPVKEDQPEKEPEQTKEEQADPKSNKTK